jgi:hypothetical protein
MLNFFYWIIIYNKVLTLKTVKFIFNLALLTIFINKFSNKLSHSTHVLLKKRKTNSYKIITTITNQIKRDSKKKNTCQIIDFIGQ